MIPDEAKRDRMVRKFEYLVHKYTQNASATAFSIVKRIVFFVSIGMVILGVLLWVVVLFAY